jgi:hypothetical protein
LPSEDGTRAGIDTDYWNYIALKYRDATVYLTGVLEPIVVEDNGNVAFVVMPRAIPQKQVKKVDVKKNKS